MSTMNIKLDGTAVFDGTGKFDTDLAAFVESKYRYYYKSDFLSEYTDRELDDMSEDDLAESWYADISQNDDFEQLDRLVRKDGKNVVAVNGEFYLAEPGDIEKSPDGSFVWKAPETALQLTLGEAYDGESITKGVPGKDIYAEYLEGRKPGKGGAAFEALSAVADGGEDIPDDRDLGDE